MAISAQDLDRVKAALEGDDLPEHPTGSAGRHQSCTFRVEALRLPEASFAPNQYHALQPDSASEPAPSEPSGPDPAAAETLAPRSSPRETIYQRLRRAKPIAEKDQDAGPLKPAPAASIGRDLDNPSLAQDPPESTDWVARVAALRARAELLPEEEAAIREASDASPAVPATVELVSLRLATRGKVLGHRSFPARPTHGRTGPFRWLV